MVWKRAVVRKVAKSARKGVRAVVGCAESVGGEGDGEGEE